MLGIGHAGFETGMILKLYSCTVQIRFLILVEPPSRDSILKFWDLRVIGDLANLRNQEIETEVAAEQHLRTTRERLEPLNEANTVARVQHDSASEAKIL